MMTSRRSFETQLRPIILMTKLSGCTTISSSKINRYLLQAYFLSILLLLVTGVILTIRTIHSSTSFDSPTMFKLIMCCWSCYSVVAFAWCRWMTREKKLERFAVLVSCFLKQNVRFCFLEICEELNAFSRFF